MDNNLAPNKTLSAQNALLTVYDSKDESHRLQTFILWLHENNFTWYSPNLDAYRDYLLNRYQGRDDRALSPTSAKAHLSTIRGRYRKLLHDNTIRDYFYSQTSSELSPSDKKAIVDELLERIQNAINPDNARIKTITQQDIHDDLHLRLTNKQVSILLTQPDKTRLMGIRDKSILALLICTGIREAELCAVNVEDLRKTLGGELALHIKQGKGAKERLIPYGDLDWSLVLVEKWLSSAQIDSGAVFRGFFRGGKRIRPTRLTVRAINQILDKYPIQIGDEIRKVAPHDLRRTYARQLYESGMDLLAIRDNLGHTDTRTTLKYIGTMDIEARKPQNVFSLPDTSSET